MALDTVAASTLAVTKITGMRGHFDAIHGTLQANVHERQIRPVLVRQLALDSTPGQGSTFAVILSFDLPGTAC